MSDEQNFDSGSEDFQDIPNVVLVPLIKGRLVREQAIEVFVKDVSTSIYSDDLKIKKMHDRALEDPLVLQKLIELGVDPLGKWTSPFNLSQYEDRYGSSRDAFRWSSGITCGIAYVANIRENFSPTNFLQIIPKKTPIILLDVDGVINMMAVNIVKDKYGYKNRTPIDLSELPFGDVTIVKVMGPRKECDIKYSPTVVSQINEWAEVAEVRWTTSWGRFAQTCLAPALGLKHFQMSRWGKWSSDFVTKGLSADDLDRPIIWIDDELGGIEKYADLMQSAAKLKEVAKNEVLLVETVQVPGLQLYLSPNQIELIDAFILRKLAEI